MPAPIPVPIRRTIYQRWQQGQDAARIAQELDMAPRTVRHLIQRFRHRGEAGIAPDYRGPEGIDDANRHAARQAALALRRQHPRWGAPLIRSLLLRDRPAAAVTSARTLQRWFSREGLGRPVRSQEPTPPRGRATRPHEVWQMDASEDLATAGGRVSWLRIVDEFTGAALQTRVFSRGTVDERAGGDDHRGAA
jgi:hypothetical protein